MLNAKASPEKNGRGYNCFRGVATPFASWWPSSCPGRSEPPCYTFSAPPPIRYNTGRSIIGWEQRKRYCSGGSGPIDSRTTDGGTVVRTNRKVPEQPSRGIADPPGQNSQEERQTLARVGERTVAENDITCWPGLRSHLLVWLKEKGKSRLYTFQTKFAFIFLQWLRSSP